MESNPTIFRTLQLPPYLSAVNAKDFDSERLRFFLRLAALYATQAGTISNLAIRLGKSSGYFNGVERGACTIRISGDMAYAIEKICGGIVTRKDLRPDLFA